MNAHHVHLFLLCALCVFALPSAADAAETPPYIAPMPPPGAGPTEFSFTPGVWLPRLGGNARFGNDAVATRLEIDDDLDLRDRSATFNAELTIRRADYWDLHFGGFSFSQSTNSIAPRAFQFGTLALAPGDPFHSDIDFTSVAGELRIGFLQPFRRHDNDATGDYMTSDGDRRADIRFAPLFGVRYIDINHSLEAPGVGRETAGGEWIAPYGGLHFEITYRPDGLVPHSHIFRLETNVGIGPAFGGDGGFLWQVRAGFSWHATPHFGLMFGYRLVHTDVENGDYRLDAGLQGLFLAGSVRF
jgi:hypothetical protein